jgi:selenocysteine lyase/cysteine desulfurase
MSPGRYFSQLRRREFTRLAGTYLDYTGAALYPESLVLDHARLLAAGVFGNPHSESPASRASTAAVECARRDVLRFLDADPEDYEVCFTSNASGAIRLVGEAFPFTPSSRLLLAADNHNSVNGIREYARRAGAESRILGLDPQLRLSDISSALGDSPAGAAHLLAYPAQSNFSGVRHPLDWIAVARRAGFRVLLDAAAYLPTSRLSLSRAPADFVALSFYKMFGYPTGIGALVARRDALAELRRPWFAGGTVEFVSNQSGTHRLRRGAEGFEDGTVSFLAASAVSAGLGFLDRVGMQRVAAHVQRLTGQALRALSALRFQSGSPRVQLYGPRDLQDRGGTIAFNLLTPSGEVMDYREVEQRAGLAGISLRGGCFCNPGAAEHAFGFPADAARRCFAEGAERGFDLDRLKRCLGRPVGALRASFGLASSADDVASLIDFIEKRPSRVRRRALTVPPSPAAPPSRAGTRPTAAAAPGPAGRGG